MALLPIKISPGFFKNGTQYQAKNRWYNGNLVRFSEGRLRPIGGWQRLAETQITKKGGVETLTITTPGSAYSGGGALSATGGGGSSFAGTYTVFEGLISTVTITDPGTGYTSVPTIVLTPTSGSAGSGAVITPTLFSGVDPIRGLHSWRLSTGARYLAVGSVQSLRIWDGSQSAGTNAPIYDITPPTSPGSALPFHQQVDFQIAGLGFGALEYGGDTGVVFKLSGSGGFASTAYTGSTVGGDVYGTPRYPPVDPDVQDADAFRDNYASCVSFDNFGDDLLACHSGEGTIWYWSPAAGGSTTGIFTTSCGITALTPVGPTPASIQPTTSGQWQCGDPATNATLVELTHTNVSQTSTSGSGTGAKFTVVTQLGLVVSSVYIYRASTQIANIPDTSLLSVGMLVHGLSGYGHSVTPTIATITNSTTIQLSAANGSGSGSYATGHVSFQVPTALYLKSVTTTTVGTGYGVNDTIIVTDPGNTTYVATITVSTINSTITDTEHGLANTNKVQVSSLGTLPGGLAVFTDLYVRDKTTDTFNLATSSGGTAIALTSPGSGIHTWENFGSAAISFNNATQTATAPVALQTLSGSTGVPTGSNVAVLVTPERHIMILGPDGAHRTIQWGSQESLTDFSPTLLNTAGDLDLQTKGRIIGGFKTRYGVLIFTTSDVWRTNYLGPPYVYGVERLTEGAGPVGMKCVAGSADFCAWLSSGRFWSYTGGYIKELSCEVADYVFGDINLDVEGLIAAGHNGQFGEITWFYPKEGDSVCKRYVTYSYREEHWVTGELERVALEPSDALGYPVWAGSDGYLYRHEMDPDTHSVTVPRDSSVTVPADIDELSTKANRVIAKGVDTSLHPNVATENHLCYVETGAIEIGGGNKMMSVTQILTDTEAGSNGLRLECVTGKTPDAPGTTHGPFILEGDGYSDCRFTDRQTFLKVSSPFDQEWRFGEVRFNASASGKR